MARKAASKGGNLLQIFAFDASGVADTLEIEFDKTVDTSITGYYLKSTGTSIQINSRIMNEAWTTFMDDYMLVDEPEQGLQENYEDDTKDNLTDASNVDKKFLYVLYSGIVDNKRLVDYGVGYLTGDTGNRSQARQSLTNAPVTVQSLAADVEYTIPDTVFSTAHVSSASTQTVATAALGGNAWFVKA